MLNVRTNNIVDLRVSHQNHGDEGDDGGDQQQSIGQATRSTTTKIRTSRPFHWMITLIMFSDTHSHHDNHDKEDDCEGEDDKSQTKTLNVIIRHGFQRTEFIALLSDFIILKRNNVRSLILLYLV